MLQSAIILVIWDKLMKRYLLYINGKETPSSSGEWIASINPYTTEPWAEIPRGNAEDANRAVEAASQAFEEGAWSQMRPTERGHLLRKVGDRIAEEAERLAKIEVQDNGKLLSEMGKQVAYLPEFYYYYGGLCDKVEGSIIPIDKPNMHNFKYYEPLGVCVAITAWNSPLLLATWKIAPALAAGNTVILKPSEHASASSLEFVKLFEEVGFPPGVVNVVTGFGSEVGAALVTHPKVAKVSFTGGEAGGRKVGELAASDFTHVTLELGGKSPNIVFPDADLQNAVKGVISGIFAATGQTCIAGSRLIVHEEIHDEFVEALIAFAKKAQLGDPLLPTTQVGPIATKDQYGKVLEYINIAKEEGATCVLGGKPGKGWFIEPTIFTDVSNTMRIAREEVFGPVLSVLKFKDEEEAVAIANDSNYGLAAGLWTQDTTRILTLPRKLKAGTVWVNTYRVVSFLSPVGGYKHSGIGRENGKDAIFSYLQTKSVWINTETEVPDPFAMRL